jgi:hypothetical protein
MRPFAGLSGFGSRKYLIAYNGYDAGLGNRVRVVLASKSLAELEGRSFLYVWPTGEKFGPRFSDLWEIDDGRRVSRATSRLLARRYPYVDEKLAWLDDRAREQRVWQIRTGGILALPPEARTWQEEFRGLVPVPAVADVVRDFHREHVAGRPYIGVMIRAHSVSHAKTRQISPVEWFVQRMTEIRKAEPDVQFFLSCDVPEVQQDVMARVGGCHAQTDKGAYNSTQAVRASVADLYLLASSGYLLGPYGSSFIHLAEYLSGDVLTLETAKATAPGHVDFRTAGIVSDPLRPFVRSAAP